MLELGLILYHYDLSIKLKVYYIIRLYIWKKKKLKTFFFQIFLDIFRFFSEKTVLDRTLTRFLA